MVDSPTTLPPDGRFTIGKMDAQISSAYCWNAHSSSTTRSAVKPRAAAGLDGNALHTLGGSERNVSVTSMPVAFHTGPAHPGGTLPCAATSAGIAPKMTPSRRTSSFASSSAREKHTTVRPARNSIVCAASARASHVTPSCRAFRIMFSRWSHRLRRSSSCCGQRSNGCTSCEASLSSRHT